LLCKYDWAQFGDIVAWVHWTFIKYTPIFFGRLTNSTVVNYLKKLPLLCIAKVGFKNYLSASDCYAARCAYGNPTLLILYSYDQITIDIDNFDGYIHTITWAT
jgi:hypothetical protein